MPEVRLELAEFQTRATQGGRRVPSAPWGTSQVGAERACKAGSKRTRKAEVGNPWASVGPTWDGRGFFFSWSLTSFLAVLPL